MSRGINKVILIGYLGRQPEMRHFPDGTPVCHFSLATSETWKDKETQEQKQTTEWHKIVLTHKLAEIAGQYLSKGAKVYIEGKLSTRKWTNQLGHDQYTTEIKANQMQMLSAATPLSPNVSRANAPSLPNVKPGQLTRSSNGCEDTSTTNFEDAGDISF